PARRRVHRSARPLPQTIDEPTALAYAAKVPRSLVEELFAVGTPDEVIYQMAEFRDQGLRYLVVGNAGAIQPSVRKSAAATAPYIKVVRGLRKLWVRRWFCNADDRPAFRAWLVGGRGVEPADRPTGHCAAARRTRSRHSIFA